MDSTLTLVFVFIATTLGVLCCPEQQWTEQTKTCIYDAIDYNVTQLRNDTEHLIVKNQNVPVTIDLMDIENRTIEVKSIEAKDNVNLTLSLQCLKCTLIQLTLENNNLRNVTISNNFTKLEKITLTDTQYSQLLFTQYIDLPLAEYSQHSQLTAMPGSQLERFNDTLRDLDLSGNLIKEIDFCFLVSMTTLMKLDLSGNQISLWPSLLLSFLSSLETLNLSSNNISTWPQVMSDQQYDSMTELILNQNSFTVLNLTYLSLFPNLTLLSMSRNPLFSTVGFLNMPRLVQLDLSFCNLFDQDGFFQQMSQNNSITRLVLSNMNFSVLPTYNDMMLMPNLTNFDFSYNNVTMLNLEIFEGTPEIVEINLEGNRIHWVQPNKTGKRLLKLEKLNLHGNKLNSICNICNQLPIASNQLDLRLSGNPLVCDVKIEWLLHCSGISSVENITCSSKGENVTKPVTSELYSQWCSNVQDSVDRQSSVVFDDVSPVQSDTPGCFTSSTRTQMLCGNRCRLADDCLSFDYVTAQKKCQLHKNWAGRNRKRGSVNPETC